MPFGKNFSTYQPSAGNMIVPTDPDDRGESFLKYAQLLLCRNEILDFTIIKMLR